MQHGMQCENGEDDVIIIARNSYELRALCQIVALLDYEIAI